MMGMLCSQKGKKYFKILTSKPTGERPLGRPKRIWEDNIRMDLKNRYQYMEISIHDGHVMQPERKKYFKILTSKPTGERPLGRTKRIWEDNIRMDLKNRYQYMELGLFC